MLTKFLFSPAARRDRIVCCLARPVGHLDTAMFAQGTGTTVVAATAWKRTLPAPSGIASPLDPPRRTVTRRGRVYLVGGGMVEVVAQTLVLAPPDPTNIPSTPPPPPFPTTHHNHHPRRTVTRRGRVYLVGGGRGGGPDTGASPAGPN